MSGRCAGPQAEEAGDWGPAVSLVSGGWCTALEGLRYTVCFCVLVECLCLKHDHSGRGVGVRGCRQGVAPVMLFGQPPRTQGSTGGTGEPLLAPPVAVAPGDELSGLGQGSREARLSDFAESLV